MWLNVWLRAAAAATTTTTTMAATTTLDFSFDIVMQNDLQITSKARTLAWLKSSAAPSSPVTRHPSLVIRECVSPLAGEVV